MVSLVTLHAEILKLIIQEVENKVQAKHPLLIITTNNYAGKFCEWWRDLLLFVALARAVMVLFHRRWEKK